jgi:hypothetical protein
MTGEGGKLDRVLSYRPGETQYVCMNPVRIGPRWKQGLPETDEPEHFPAKKKNVVQARALVVDLDVGRAGEERGRMTPESAIAAVLVLSEPLGVPAPSLMGISGRGVYVVWLIHPLDVVNPPDFDPVVKLWESTERQLIKRLVNLSADAKAKCIVHWFKRPGTTDTLMVDGIETTTGRVADFFTLVPGLADVPVYHLADLAAGVNEPAIPDDREDARPADGEAVRRPAAARGDTRRGAEPAILRVRELKALNKARGGIEEGRRVKFIFLLAVAVTEIARRRGTGLAAAETEAMKEAVEEGAKFRPPMDERQIRAEIRTLSAACKRGTVYRVSNDTAAQDLKITPEEAEALGLVSLAPASVRAARKKAAEESVAARREWPEAWARFPWAGVLHRDRKEHDKGTPERSVALGRVRDLLVWAVLRRLPGALAA